jgi:hypothetical protein
MTPELLKSYMETLKEKGLQWDQYDEAITLIHSPQDFETFFKKVHSMELCNLLFNNHSDALLYINRGPWLKNTALWILKAGLL